MKAAAGRAVKAAAPLALALAAALAGVGCAGGDSGELTVFAAASLREAFPRIAPDARFSFAGSDELAVQLREGAPADVYAAASPALPRELAAEGVVEEPVVFATNRLVLLVPRGNPAGIRSVADLAGEGVRLVVGTPGVPVGDYTRRALAELGRLDVLERVVSEESDVAGIVGKVALGEADAGFAYASDAAPAGEDVEVVELPEAAQPEVEYAIAVVRGSDDRAEGQAFVERVLGPAGREALREAGFGAP